MGRGNPAFLLDYMLDCFAALAMTGTEAGATKERGRHRGLPHKNLP